MVFQRPNLLLACGTLSCVVACSTPSTRQYTLKGQVIAIAADHTAATIKHEDIPGLMPAMTMPYKLQEPRQVEGLVPGDLISATLVLVSNDAYLTSIRRVGSAPLTTEDGGHLAASYGQPILQPGDLVPSTTFIDQDGRARSFASFHGSPALVTFMYTRCPMPTFCPLLDRHFAEIQERSTADSSWKDLHLVSVSFDPAVDTPTVLKHHAQVVGADPQRWTFLTGPPSDIDRFARQFGVTVMYEANGVDITHNLRTALVGPDGRIVALYTGNGWTPDQVLTDLAQID